MSSSRIDTAMQKAVRDGVFPAASLLVAKEDVVLHKAHYGMAREGTCFDIASLTKPVCTATLAAMLVSEGLLKQNDTVYQWLGGARLPAHRDITVHMLLTHTSGLPAWQPYYRELPLSLVGTTEGKSIILDSIFHEDVISPPGVAVRYSDIGFIMLGKILEEAGGASLHLLFDKRIAQPLKLSHTFFQEIVGRKASSSRSAQRRFAPTEDCPWRERVLRGEVHDQNAFALGGVAGHAGLFSTIDDLHRFLVSWMSSSMLRATIDQTSFQKKNGDMYVHGWNIPSPKHSAAGHLFSKESIGHLGYTGCSLWIDLTRHAWVILLSNRVHPSTTNEKIKAFRPSIHDLVMSELVV